MQGCACLRVRTEAGGGAAPEEEAEAAKARDRRQAAIEKAETALKDAKREHEALATDIERILRSAMSSAKAPRAAHRFQLCPTILTAAAGSLSRSLRVRLSIQTAQIFAGQIRQLIFQLTSHRELFL